MFIRDEAGLSPSVGSMSKGEETTFLPLTEEKPSTLLGDYFALRQKRRSMGEATLLVCGVALLCWCGYLTLTINKGVFLLIPFLTLLFQICQGPLVKAPEQSLTF